MSQINRRGLFGLAAGAAVAGPSVAREAVAQMQGHAHKSGPYPMSGPSVMPESFDPVASWRNELARLDTNFRDPDSRARYAETQLGGVAFDADLRAMRSFSEAAKELMQMQRNYERYYERRRRDLLRNIADWVAGKTGATEASP